MKNDVLDGLLAPQRIAVIGASDDISKISGRPIEYLLRYGFSGEIYPINPRREVVQGLPCYPSIKEAPGEIDLAIIAIPGEAVVAALNECAGHQVKTCVIFSSGFAEVGEQGKNIQKSISEVAAQTGMRILGPNCQGVVNLHNRSVASFSTCFAEAELAKGYSAIASQSGAVAAMVYNLQKQWGSGLKYWIATGNEADLTVSELLSKLLDDDDIRVVQAYMEDIKQPEKLLEAAKKARKLGKPILALKAGRTPEGQKAASSHTGALAGEDVVLNAIFKRHGIVAVRDVHELASFPQVFAQGKKARGRNVAILSNSGGLAVMMVDQCKEQNLELAKLSKATVDELETMLPSFGSAANPIDLTAQLLVDKKLLSNALPVLARDPGVDIILLGLGIMGKGYDIPTIVKDIASTNSSSEQLVGVAWVAGQQGVVEQFAAYDVPVFDNPTMCVDAMAKYVDFCFDVDYVHQPVLAEADEALVAVMLDGYRPYIVDGFLSEYHSKQLLRQWDLPVSREILARNEVEAVAAASAIGYPVAVKICSAAIQHKSESGSLALNITGEAQLRQVAVEMLEKGVREVGEERFEGLLIQEMFAAGFEISLGVKKDPTFGPVIMVASGGIYIEILKDFQLVVPPVSEQQAIYAVQRLASLPILEGARGGERLDIEALAQLISNLSSFVVQAGGRIEELDLNPVFVMKQGGGVRIVDALVKLAG
jgi:acyl-CoA synthetase (NDP forming)